MSESTNSVFGENSEQGGDLAVALWNAAASLLYFMLLTFTKTNKIKFEQSQLLIIIKKCAEPPQDWEFIFCVLRFFIKEKNKAKCKSDQIK